MKKHQARLDKYRFLRLYLRTSMEDSQNSQMQESNQPQEQSSYESRESSSGVSFPTVGEPKKSGGVKTLLIVGVLVLVAILGFVIYKSASNKTSDVTDEPTSFDNLTTPSDQTVQTSTSAPSATPSAKVDKSKVRIQVQNGTGITGEAAYLQTQLGNLGYSNIKVGNSSSTVTTTSVTFSNSPDSTVVSEITQKLNSIYQTVNAQTSASATFDVVVVTGLRKGATAKPSASPVSSASPSTSPSATPTRSPSPSPSLVP